MKRQKKLILVITLDKAFLSHRKEIAIEAQKQGWDVTVVVHYTGNQNKIQELGLKTIDMPLNRAGKNPFEEMQTYKFLKKLYKKEKPDVVHHVGVKLMLWGSLAAKRTNVPCIVNAIAGCGAMFTPDRLNSTVTKLIILGLHKARSNHSTYIVQNNDDKKLFIDKGIMNDNQTVLIKGSGVDTKRFAYREESEIASKKIRFAYSGRMLEEKGVMVVIQAAEQLKAKYADKIQFIFCGWIEDNPSALTEDQINAHMDGDYMTWLGFCPHVENELRTCHALVYPSFYMEGLPKAVLDAESCGLPVITTDWVGCRDAVKDGYNGFIVPPHDVQAVVEKIEFFINNPQKRQEMSKNSRELVEKNFDVKLVVKQHLQIYDSMYTKFVQSKKL
ncbi:MAG: hypothetical protein BKP49_06475 [Treponema sp. CETP13]|nr:MAG: hypothetical protein BKP49_06475 [Treponema sp. CETP13]